MEFVVEMLRLRRTVESLETSNDSLFFSSFAGPPGVVGRPLFLDPLPR